METYREHPRHCKLRRYGVELCGMVGKDVARHQRRPTLRCEPLLDVVLLQRSKPKKFLPRSHVKRVSLVCSSRGPVSEGGHLSPRLPNCHLGWDLRLLHSLFPIGPVNLGGFCCGEPQCRIRVYPQATQHYLTHSWVKINLYNPPFNLDLGIQHTPPYHLGLSPNFTGELPWVCMPYQVL